MESGRIFDVQPYSVHDGPGIRTLVFFKGCPLSCLWCCNPESQRSGPEIRFEDWRCLHCERCVAGCEKGAIAWEGTACKIDRLSCRTCDTFRCTTQCPGKALTRWGREVTSEALVAEIAKDKGFYRNSGGGVTFSGGEPFAQAAFLLETLKRCREQGIHTAIETCGHARLEDFQAAEPWVDLFLFDLKHMESQQHTALTGQGNGTILANLTWLASVSPHKVVIRYALIPGCNDARSNQQQMVDFMLAHGLKQLDVEPYHPLGQSKYAQLDKPCRCQPDPQCLAPEVLQGVLQFFRDHGIEAKLA